MNKVAGISVLVLALFGSLFAPSVSADTNGVYGQYGQYGTPGKQQSITINKTVAAGESTKGGQQVFVDNLTASDQRFSAGDTITFHLQVKNTADALLSDVKVTDFLPAHVDFVSGGSLRTDNSVVIDAGDFQPNEEKNFTVKVRVKPQDQLPQDKGVICELNKAEVKTGSLHDQDTAQFCIEKQVSGVPGAPSIPQKVPSTGPELGLLLFAGELAGLTAGVYLKKKTS